jgi:hypothetical protein
VSAAPTPPSAWILEQSVSLWQQLQDKLTEDPSLETDEYVVSPRLPRLDGEGTLPHPEVLLRRAIDAAVWNDRRADEADNLRKRYTARRDRYAQRGEAIRATIEQLLEVLGLSAAEGELGAGAMRKRPPHVLITDIDKVPPELKDTVTTVTAKKNPIGAKLKAGEVVPGAELSNPTFGLTIIPF